MEFTAIIYTSKNGHTKRYAEMLGQITRKPVFSLNNVPKSISKGSPIIYMGWLCASNIKGYKQASKKYNVLVACGVGLCDTGTMISEVREATKIPENVTIFTFQGGIDRSKLKGAGKFAISMLTKGLASKEDRTEQDNRILELLKKDRDFVSEENMKELKKFIGV